MPQYKLVSRQYTWPSYAELGKVVEEVFEAESDDIAKERVISSKQFQHYHGHAVHRNEEEDYCGDFELTKVIELP